MLEVWKNPIALLPQRRYQVYRESFSQAVEVCEDCVLLSVTPLISQSQAQSDVSRAQSALNTAVTNYETNSQNIISGYDSAMQEPDAGHDLPFRQVSITDNQSPTVLIDEMAMPVNPVLNFRVNGLSQQFSSIVLTRWTSEVEASRIRVLNSE